MQVETLIKNAHILTMDDKFTEFENGFVAIAEGKIVAIGGDDQIEPATAEHTIDAGGNIVIPGLINTHCHTAMTLFRGLADDRPLDAFLQTVWAAEGRYATPENIEAGATLGAAEMVSGGVTHVVDMYWHSTATARAAKFVGLGLTAGPVLIGMEGMDHTSWPDRIEAVAETIKALREMGADVMLMPHSCYTMDAEKLAVVTKLADEHGVGIHIHASEAPSEMALVDAAYSKRPPAVMRDAGLLDHPTLIAHAVHLNDDEIDMLAKSGVTVSHCPLSNAKLSSGTAEVAKLRAAGVVVSLGTDGPSSSNDLDMWQAMRHASFMSANHTGKPDGLPAQDVLAMATREGAKAIGLAASKGTLEIGKDADIAVIDMDALHLTPSYNPYSSLVYSAGRSDVCDVFCQGRHILKDRKLAADITRAVQDVRAISKDIISGATT